MEPKNNSVSSNIDYGFPFVSSLLISIHHGKL
jgi:hypothetical protein